MTRFATFWVEGGRIVAPAVPLRFDDSIYRLLGDKLAALTKRRELLLDTSTYGERSTASALLPGALVEALRFTL
jgi:predicted Zn-dependent protease